MEDMPESSPYDNQTTGVDPNSLGSGPAHGTSSDWLWRPEAFEGSSLPPWNPNPYPGPQPFQNTQTLQSPVTSVQQTGIKATPKIPIPRATGSSSLSQRRRSPRACEPCRKRKVKCDGGKPTCQKCRENGLHCVYIDIKRVREQKELGSLSQKVELYENLLQEIEPEVDAPLARRISKSLKAFRTPQVRSRSSSSESSSSAGSLDAIDLVKEDLNRNEKTIAAGFYGKNSEIAWMQRLEDEAGHRSQSPKLEMSHGTSEESQKRDASIMAMSYHLDDINLPFPESVNPYALPRREIADQYFKMYMESVHPSFSVIRKTTFTAQYEQFFNHPSSPPPRWLAVLNMVFAIGCRYCKLSGIEVDDENSDMEYLNRARKLSLSGNVLFEHADLQQIQVEFLVALYLVALGQINRAFKFSSIAVRSAVSLGINLRLVDDRTHFASKEARARLWWSLYLLENLLTSITGRFSGVSEGLSAAPLPIPLDEEEFQGQGVLDHFRGPSQHANHLQLTLFQRDEDVRATAEWLSTCEPSASLFFHCVVDLSVISQAVINNVYSIQSLREHSHQVEQKIHNYSRSMESWLRKVPWCYSFTLSQYSDQFHVLPNATFKRERVILAIYYYSARISLYRPCLSHTLFLDLASSQHRSRRYRMRTRMAFTGLLAACSLLSILPEEPDVVWLTKFTPWWAIIHYIMQATTALLIGLSSWPAISEMSPDTSMPTLNLWTIVTQTKKSLRWLHRMGCTDRASRRAFTLCESLLHRIASIIGLDLRDVPQSETFPPLGDEE